MTNDDLSVEELITEQPLPDEDWDEFWSRIYVDEQDKEKLVNYGLLLRQFQEEQLDRMTLSHHGVILLTGPPGTGKTSLAKGAANELAKRIPEEVDFKRIEVQQLFSGNLGDTPKLVENAFRQVIEPARNPEYDAYQVLLLDEVESLFSSRSMLSGDTDPMDAVRAVNTALEAIDELSELPGVYLIATSNQPRAVDRAYYDRTDDQIFLGNPEARHRESILLDIFNDMNETLGSGLPTDPDAIEEAVEKTEGFSGRRIRKTVLAALSRNEETVLEPHKLSYDQVLEEIERTYELIREKGSSDYINLGETPEESLPDSDIPGREVPGKEADARPDPTSMDRQESSESPTTSLEERTEQPSSRSERRTDPTDVTREETSNDDADDATDSGPSQQDEEVEDNGGSATGGLDDEQVETAAGSENDGGQSGSGTGADAGSQESETSDNEEQEDWLEPRTVVFDTAAMNPVEEMRDDMVSYFVETLERAGYQHPDRVEATFETEGLIDQLDHLCMRRKLSAVSVTVGKFTTTVEVATDRTETVVLQVPVENALPTLEGTDQIVVTLHVESGTDVEPIKSDRDGITITTEST